MSRTSEQLVATAQIALAPADHKALLRIAAHHERSARAEAVWAVRQWIAQHSSVLETEDTAS